jgi:hypothetical protein
MLRFRPKSNIACLACILLPVFGLLWLLVPLNVECYADADCNGYACVASACDCLTWRCGKEGDPINPIGIVFVFLVLILLVLFAMDQAGRPD